VASISAGRDNVEGSGFRGSPVVGYIRSAKLGDPQLDEWEGQIRHYASERGYNLVEVVRDEGVSAVTVWKPELERLISKFTTAGYAGVITPHRSSLAQSPSAVTRTISRIVAAGAWIEFLD